jgi:hypothetical protein
MREKPAQSTSVLDELVFVGRSSPAESGPAEWTGERPFPQLATPLVEPLSSGLRLGNPDTGESHGSDLTVRQQAARFMILAMLATSIILIIGLAVGYAA